MERVILEPLKSEPTNECLDSCISSSLIYMIIDNTRRKEDIASKLLDYIECFSECIHEIEFLLYLLKYHSSSPLPFPFHSMASHSRSLSPIHFFKIIPKSNLETIVSILTFLPLSLFIICSCFSNGKLNLTVEAMWASLWD